MINIVKLSAFKNVPKDLPRQRVFHVGYRYLGPVFYQSIQHLYLKIKGVTK